MYPLGTWFVWGHRVNTLYKGDKYNDDDNNNNNNNKLRYNQNISVLWAESLKMEVAASSETCQPSTKLHGHTERQSTALILQ